MKSTLGSLKKIITNRHQLIYTGGLTLITAVMQRLSNSIEAFIVKKSIIRLSPLEELLARRAGYAFYILGNVGVAFCTRAVSNYI